MKLVKRKYTKEELRSIRRKVMTIAACLIRVRNYARKRAMIVAWQMVKQVFCTKVVGVIFGKRQKALKNLLNYNPRRIQITLQHEANNPYDENAIAVIVTVIGKGSYQIGYMKKPFAEVYAHLLKKGIDVYAKFEGITGGGNNSYYGLILAM